MIARRTMTRARAGLLAGAAALAVLALPVAAGASHAAKTKPFSCLTPAQLNTITKGNYGAPKKGAGFAATAGTCTYTSPSGSTFVIAHAPLGGTKLKKDATLVSGHDHLSSVSGLGQGALIGKGKIDVLFVQQKSFVYSFRDGSGAASPAQLESVARLVVPA
jgi:hypothetical protein